MFGAVLSKFDNAVLSMVIAIDTDNENIHFYSMTEGNRSTLAHHVESCRASLFSDDFYEKLTIAISSFREKHPEVSMQKCALLLPNRVFMFDTINVPSIKKQAMANSLTLSISSLYKNNKDLKFNNYALAQNKQYATYGIIGIRKEILIKVKKACEDAGAGIQEITLTANALANSAFVLNPDLKNDSFLLLDVKEDSANYAYIIKGKMVGYYHLPFGYNMLYKSRLAAEDLLFDHATGELLVLNAKEKAKARQLTTMDQTSTLGTAGTEFDEDDEEMNNNEQLEVSFENRGNQYKKVARKLPKFMLRETPKTKEEYVYENFRIFMKWSQDLLINNPILTSIGLPKQVYVNMPREYDFVYEMANNSEESKITYLPLVEADAYEEEVFNNLELFGGFYVKQHNRLNNF